MTCCRLSGLKIAVANYSDVEYASAHDAPRLQDSCKESSSAKPNFTKACWLQCKRYVERERERERERTDANLLVAKIPNAREDAQSSGPLAMYHTKITDLVSSPRTLAVWEGEADGSRHFSNSKAGGGIYIHIYMMTRFFALSDVYKEFSNGSFASERYFGGPKS